MPVEPVLIYDQNGDFVGWTSLRRVPHGAKLTSTNVWPNEQFNDLQEQIDRANSDVVIKAHWPRTDDPEVQKLLHDSNFMPYETTTERVVDDDNSYYVWDKTGPDGKPLPGARLDRQASVLTYKDEVVPVRPAEVQLRFKRAHEIVARRRAGLEEGEALHLVDGASYASSDDPNG